MYRRIAKAIQHDRVEEVDITDYHQVVDNDGLLSEPSNQEMRMTNDTPTLHHPQLVDTCLESDSVGFEAGLHPRRFSWRRIISGHVSRHTTNSLSHWKGNTRGQTFYPSTSGCTWAYAHRGHGNRNIHPGGRGGQLSDAHGDLRCARRLVSGDILCLRCFTEWSEEQASNLRRCQRGFVWRPPLDSIEVYIPNLWRVLALAYLHPLHRVKSSLVIFSVGILRRPLLSPLRSL